MDKNASRSIFFSNIFLVEIEGVRSKNILLVLLFYPVFDPRLGSHWIQETASLRMMQSKQVEGQDGTQVGGKDVGMTSLFLQIQELLT